MFFEILAGIALLAGLSRSGSSSSTVKATPPVSIDNSKVISEVQEPNTEVHSINVKRLEFNEKHFLITDLSLRTSTLFFSDIWEIPSFTEESKVSITVNVQNGIKYNLLFSKPEEANKYFNQISAKVITSISNAIIECYDLSARSYLRESTINNFNDKLCSYAADFQIEEDFWRSHLKDEVVEKLLFLKRYLPLSDGKKELRKQYESNTLKARRKFYDEIESNPLTKQQRLAVIRENDLNLILAAAGTGKTSVIVAKLLDLISSGRVKTNEILVLAYNNSAAKELRDRILQRGASCNITKEICPSVFTFHALGKLILRESNIPSYLSVFAEDSIKLNMWVTHWLIDYIKSSPSALQNFIQLIYQPVNPFDFETREEYDAYVRDNEYRTLQGERVRSYQELIIANWFYLNGVDYEYEPPFVSKRRVDIGFDYRPDFHFTNTNIYLEHFGIDRNGNTRKGIDKDAYNKSILNKRKLHQECGTTLIETYHYDWVEDNLETKLLEILKNEKIATNPKSPGEIFDVLNNMGFIEESAKRYLRCMQAIRFEKLDQEHVLKRLIESNVTHAEKYSALLNKLHNSYKSELESQNRIDFDDMILKSTEAIIDGRFNPDWKYILVDEFQDISMARMDLLKALVRYGPVPVLSVVGDDWQSIYRFSGGKLELTTRIGDVLGKHSLTKMEKTFRYSSSIADLAGTFIMKNPEQYKKEVKTQVKDTHSQVFLLDSKVGKENNPTEQVVEIIKKIRKEDQKGSIAVLARYNYLLTKAKKRISQKRLSFNVKYWTFHSSKGLEADYCILIGFFQGKTGFPNMNKDEAIVEALLPSLDQYPHSEERRLFYVAITRARRQCYLIADPMAPSEFINEILTPKYSLQIVSERFNNKFRKMYKCPLCTDGYFILKSGQYGDFYTCSSGSVCPSHPRTCEKCGAPSIDERNKSVCRNEDCGNEKVICNVCGRPMKTRKGRYGEFLGCTGYGIKGDQCKNTRQIY